jgi:hypothetical protein
MNGAGSFFRSHCEVHTVQWRHGDELTAPPLLNVGNRGATANPFHNADL